MLRELCFLESVSSLVVRWCDGVGGCWVERRVFLMYFGVFSGLRLLGVRFGLGGLVVMALDLFSCTISDLSQDMISTFVRHNDTSSPL